MTVSLRRPVLVSLPRSEVEEGLVNIQAASREVSTWLERGSRCVEDGNLPGGLKAIATADTLNRLIGHDAYDLAGQIRDCPDGLSGPSGHAA
jgi:hypothetical protein